MQTRNWLILLLLLSSGADASLELIEHRVINPAGGASALYVKAHHTLADKLLKKTLPPLESDFVKPGATGGWLYVLENKNSRGAPPECRPEKLVLPSSFNGINSLVEQWFSYSATFQLTPRKMYQLPGKSHHQNWQLHFGHDKKLALKDAGFTETSPCPPYQIRWIEIYPKTPTVNMISNDGTGRVHQRSGSGFFGFHNRPEDKRYFGRVGRGLPFGEVEYLVMGAEPFYLTQHIEDSEENLPLFDDIVVQIIYSDGSEHHLNIDAAQWQALTSLADQKDALYNDLLLPEKAVIYSNRDHRILMEFLELWSSSSAQDDIPGLVTLGGCQSKTNTNGAESTASDSQPRSSGISQPSVKRASSLAGDQAGDQQRDEDSSAIICEFCREHFLSQSAFKEHEKTCTAGFNPVPDCPGEPEPEKKRSDTIIPALSTQVAALNSELRSDSQTDTSLTPEEYDFFHSQLQDHKDIALALAWEQIGKPLNEQSLYSIASALYAAKINSLSEAKELSLTITPPGPVFHTWYAAFNTTLFDGENNPKKYDYVSKIRSEADFLKQFNIPVLLVYTSLRMTPEQTELMETLFLDHDNIITISFETDVPSLHLTEILERISEYNLTGRINAMRYLTLLNKEFFLEVAEKKAIAADKHRLVENIVRWGKESLTYSDFDNVITRPDLYLLTAPGYISCNNPLFSEAVIWSRMNHENCEVNPKLLEMTEEYRQITSHVTENHINFISQESEARIRNDKLHYYILSGNFQKYLNFLEKEYILLIWETECGFFRSATTATSHLNPSFIQSQHYIGDAFRQNQAATDRSPHYLRLLTLAGMQLLRLLHVNYHNSWHKKK